MKIPVMKRQSDVSAKPKEPTGRKVPKGERHARRVLEIPPTGQTPPGQSVGTDVATRHEPYLFKYAKRKSQ